MNLRRIFSVILICLALFACASLFSCGKGSSSYEENVGTKIICKESDFKSVKDDWYGKKSLVSDKALDIHTNTLVAGEKYYFVYTVFLEYVEKEGETLPILGELDLNFSIKVWGDIYDNTVSGDKNGVTIHKDEVACGDEFKYMNDAFYLKDFDDNDGALHSAKGYIAVPFTPERSGTMYIDSDWRFLNDKYVKFSDTSPSVYANVFENEETLRSSSHINISNFSYRLISESDYENNIFDKGEATSSPFQLVEGRNYLIVDYDVTLDASCDGEIYCGIFMRNGNWTDAKLEQANTSKTTRVDKGSRGELFEFGYSLPQNGTKSIRTIFSFKVSRAPDIDFEIFLYSNDARIDGTTYSNGQYYGVNTSELKYRFDSVSQEYHVIGYKTMTGDVIVPAYYEGYPVVGIDDEAFEGCTELKSVNMPSIESIGKAAFKDCTSLDNVSLGNKLRVLGERAFCNTDLRTIKIPATTAYIGRYAFDGCERFFSISFGVWTGWRKDGVPTNLGMSSSLAKTLANNGSFTLSRPQN